MLSSPGPKSRPRPPSQTRRPTGSTMPAPTSPARLRTQSHTPARARATTLTPAPLEPDVPPPPYTQDSTPTQRPNPRHSLTEIDDMLNVAGSVVRNRERELDAAALASRSLLEENKLMFAKREALLARLPISPRTSISSTYSSPAERSHQPTNRSSSWSTCSEESDMDASVSTTPRRDASTPVPFPTDPLEAHRIHTPSGSVDFGSLSKLAFNGGASPPQPPAARLVPTQAERIAALHAGLTSPPPAGRTISTSRRVSVSPAAVTHLQDANAALLARVQELEEATAKAQSEGAARMRRLQTEAETLRAQLGEAERANEGLRTEAEKEKEKLRVRTKSAGASAARHQKKQSADADEPVPPVPRDFAPGATWRPEFRSLRGGVRPAAAEEASKAVPRTPTRSATGSTVASRAAATPVRAQSIATPSRSATQGSPLKHTPLKPSMLRHQRANSYAGKQVLSPVKSMSPPGTVFEESENAGAGAEEMKMEAEEAARMSPTGMKPSPIRINPGILPFPSSDVPDEVDMSPLSTRILAQELVAKINELRSTNEEIQQQRDALKDMLMVAEAEAEELKRVCERLENEVERSSEGTGSGGEGRASGGEGRKSGGEGRRSGGEGMRFGAEDLSLQLDAQSLGIRPLEMGDLGEEPAPEWTGSVRGRKGGGALQSLAAELGVMAELQAPTDDEGAEMVASGRADLASELLNAGSVPTTPTDRTTFLPHKPNTPKRRGSISRSAVSTPGVQGTSAAKTPASSKRGLGNRGLATRAKTNPRRVRKSLSSVMFNSGGKALPSPVSSPTGLAMSPVDEVDKWAITTPEKAARSEFVSPAAPEVYLTPASTLRTPGSVSRALGLGLVGDDEEEDKGKGKDKEALALMSPSTGRNRSDTSTMAQLRAALDPLLMGVVQGHQGEQPLTLDSPSPITAGGLVRRKPSNLRLLFKDEKDMEPWETKLRDLYSDIKAFEQEDAGMSSAGEEAWRGSRRARALGRLSLRRKVDDGASDYAADDSEACDGAVRKSKRAQEEEDAKRVAGFELARKLQQKSMSTFLEVLLLVQFAVVLVVFVYTAVRRGPKAVLGARRVDRR